MTTSEAAWTERFRAVSQAQARYLYLLLAACAFYWSLQAQMTDDSQGWPPYVPVLFVGITVDPGTVAATAPLVLALLILSVLGTFAALRDAAKAMGSVTSDEDFQRLDSWPNAIDFVVYSRGPTLRRLGLLSYPVVLSLAYLEAWWLFVENFEWARRPLGGWVFVGLGALALIAAIPRMLVLWSTKIRRLLGLNGPA